MIKYLLPALLIACAPSKLDIKDGEVTNFPESIDTNSEIETPKEFGVIEEEDCDQSALGSSVCNIVLYDQNENVWQLYDHAGKIVILDFSTAWCYPCQVAGMSTQAIQDDYAGDVVFATLLIEGTTGAPTTHEDVTTWVEDHNVTNAPVLRASRDYVMDPQGITGYLVGGYPTYVYIGRDMKIATAHVGFSEEYVRTVLNGLL